MWVTGLTPLGFACAPSPGSGAAGASGGSAVGGVAGASSAAGTSSAAGGAGTASGGTSEPPASGSGGEAPLAGASSGAGGSAGFGGGAGATSGGTSGAAAAGGSGGSGPCAATTLKDAGSCSNRLIGVALTNRHLGEPELAAAALEFNYVTPEDEMKWDVTEPQPGTFTFEEGDAIVEFAEANGMKVKGHTLVWHNQLPTWLNTLNETQLRAALKAHIEGVMAHYAGRVIAWDVVNEAFGDDGALRDSIWSQKLGRSFIEDSFRYARAADPNVKLYYNDYDIESAYDKADSVYEMVKDFKARGVPLDGVGMQMHTRTTDEDPPVPEFVANLERLLALGVEVVLSEMDVRYCADGTDEKQKKRFHDIVAACVAHPGCGAITVWGITDKYSFLNDRTDLQCAGSLPPRPLLWNDTYEKKPSFDGVLDALLGR
ncbi:MAG: endo-1,4-beta-xylanase [Myxococcales bacterium]|nr:MAG: endo-1,4-beta-xylanase [Myxococcales bacterium]